MKQLEQFGVLSLRLVFKGGFLENRYWKLEKLVELGILHNFDLNFVIVSCKIKKLYVGNERIPGISASRTKVSNEANISKTRINNILVSV